MVKFRLRTKLLLSLVFTTTALTCAALLIVQYRMRERARQEIYESLRNSVITFQNFQRQRQMTLARSAGLLANLPNLKALMTTFHAPTIQDGSMDFARLAGSDLFVLADRSGKIVALQTTAAGFGRGTAHDSLARTLRRGENRDWWFGRGHLYEVFIQPIYFGSPVDNSLLGVLAMGYEVDDRVASEVSQIASSQVAFRYGKTLAVSTLLPQQQLELAKQHEHADFRTALGPEDINLGGERFLGTSVLLTPSADPTVSLTVLKSYDRATVFVQNLNRLLLGVGFMAVLAGSGLVFFISHTFTKPLSNLVSGVRALERGDFSFPLGRHGNDEVAELTTAFDTMRTSLQKSQQDLLHAERLATIGRMASSISHDLRHPLTAILAYAEFLAESNLDEQQRMELYEEIRLATGRMTDLIASMLEFSKAQEALQPGFGNFVETLERAIRTVRVRPEFRGVTVRLFHDGPLEGWFDSRKLERVFHNLLMNACEAVPPDSGKVEVSSLRTNERIEIRIGDNGRGIPESIRGQAFQPFVSSGKENGTGLGLAVAQKIVEDHGGEICVEATGESGTVIKLTLPLTPPIAGS
jgi:signal transduction histidine kinase